ncbi:MAG: Fur family transcriptional regulator [Spirulinaceae cyanobacterium]
MTSPEIRDRMKAQGLRITPQRYAVYANLLERQDHPTVEQILAAVNAELPIASKASVYTALTVLRQVGLVREVLLEEGLTRYDANVEPHHHFVCEGCGAIVDIDWQLLGHIDLSALPERLAAQSYEVTVKGDRCDRCG